MHVVLAKISINQSKIFIKLEMQISIKQNNAVTVSYVQMFRSQNFAEHRNNIILKWAYSEDERRQQQQPADVGNGQYELNLRGNALLSTDPHTDNLFANRSVSCRLTSDRVGRRWPFPKNIHPSHEIQLEHFRIQFHEHLLLHMQASYMSSCYLSLSWLDGRWLRWLIFDLHPKVAKCTTA